MAQWAAFLKMLITFLDNEWSWLLLLFYSTQLNYSVTVVDISFHLPL